MPLFTFDFQIRFFAWLTLAGERLQQQLFRDFWVAQPQRLDWTVACPWKAALWLLCISTIRPRAGWCVGVHFGKKACPTL